MLSLTRFMSWWAFPIHILIFSFCHYQSFTWMYWQISRTSNMWFQAESKGNDEREREKQQQLQKCIFLNTTIFHQVCPCFWFFRNYKQKTRSICLLVDEAVSKQITHLSGKINVNLISGRLQICIYMLTFYLNVSFNHFTKPYAAFITVTVCKCVCV